MTIIGALVIVLGFIILINSFGVMQKSKLVIENTQAAFLTFLNKDINDLQKEIALQKYAKVLFFHFLLITLYCIIAIVIPISIIWLMDLLGIIALKNVIDTTCSWQFLALTGFISILVLIKIRKNE
ncbi:hypothetical protein JW960_28450 [candidate division KSB1 bacterium]|nr:hypothetical protein [candidate division KSB1 bacterium]